ncbi:MAG: T9SS type A sorting domain-containing protein [Bacteroidales bacterium]|nr:T9SS type A sorting domain-containing protein [Bacteroidales bacterium]
MGQDILLYPNPTSDQLHFACATEKEIQLAVYAMNGQLLLSQTLSTSETLDVSSLSTGMYIIKINHFAYKFNKW